MTFAEIKKFLVWEQERLNKKFPIPDKEKFIFARMVKITEELGELSEAVLSSFQLQRTDKLKLGKKEISNEIADVLIGVMLLANQLDIDIAKTLEEKINIIKARNYE
jgi:NTP pyrophosphatase (non-canonical NTP hydrolase)